MTYRPTQISGTDNPPPPPCAGGGARFYTKCWFFAMVGVNLVQCAMLSHRVTSNLDLFRARGVFDAEVQFAAPAAPPSMPEGKQSAFEQAYGVAYFTAIAAHNATSPRPNAFNVSEWTALGRASTGGLSDWDRVKIAEIYGHAGSVFEYGLGESTKLAAGAGVPRYAGTDSIAQWVATARDGSPEHFRFSLADVGSTRAWGRSNNPHAPKNALNYQVAPLFVEGEAFDVYMVDGRWRAACALVALLHASWARGHRGGGAPDEPRAKPLILIHDFVEPGKSVHCGPPPTNCNAQRIRSTYHRVKEVADMVDHSGNKLAVFRRKANATDAQILELWKELMTVSG